MLTTLFFYKGTCFPLTVKDLKLDDITIRAKEMIKKGLESNVSIKEQIEIYLEQLNDIEEMLLQFNPEEFRMKPDETKMKQMKQMNVVWMLDISALIIMKHLKNDEMNGFLTIDGLLD